MSTGHAQKEKEMNVAMLMCCAFSVVLFDGYDFVFVRVFVDILHLALSISICYSHSCFFANNTQIWCRRLTVF